MKIKVKIQGEHIFDSEDDWGLPDAYEAGGTKAVRDVLRDDPVDLLATLGTPEDLITIEVIEE